MKVFVLGGVFVFFASRVWSERRRSTNYEASKEPSSASTYFRYAPPTVWLVARDLEPEAILIALGAKEARRGEWEEGFGPSPRCRWVAAPRYDEWTLIFGNGLDRLVADPDRAYVRLRELSRQLGMVQLFYRDATGGGHGWALADRGDILRAFLWEETTQWNQGVVTSGERRLGMVLPGYGEAGEKTRSNVDRVFALAKRWSVNPQEIPDSVWDASEWAVGQ